MDTKFANQDLIERGKKICIGKKAKSFKNYGSLSPIVNYEAEGV